MADEKLQEIIAEIEKLESERPSQIEINFPQQPRSLRPKVPDTFFAKVVAIVIALGAIAAAVREALK